MKKRTDKRCFIQRLSLYEVTYLRINIILFSIHTIGGEHHCARPIGLFGCRGLGPLTLTFTITGVHCWTWWRHSLIKSTTGEQYKGHVNFKKKELIFLTLLFLKKSIVPYVACKTVGGWKIHRGIGIQNGRVVGTSAWCVVDTIWLSTSWNEQWTLAHPQ